MQSGLSTFTETHRVLRYRLLNSKYMLQQKNIIREHYSFFKCKCWGQQNSKQHKESSGHSCSCVTDGPTHHIQLIFWRTSPRTVWVALVSTFAWCISSRPKRIITVPSHQRSVSCSPNKVWPKIACNTVLNHFYFHNPKVLKVSSSCGGIQQPT